MCLAVCCSITSDDEVGLKVVSKMRSPALKVDMCGGIRRGNEGIASAVSAGCRQLSEIISGKKMDTNVCKRGERREEGEREQPYKASIYNLC